MALLLYPNISGLEMVLFFFFNSTVEKIVQTSSFILTSTSKEWGHQIPWAGDSIQYKQLWPEYKSYTLLKNKNKIKNSKSTADC